MTLCQFMSHHYFSNLNKNKIYVVFYLGYFTIPKRTLTMNVVNLFLNSIHTPPTHTHPHRPLHNSYSLFLTSCSYVILFLYYFVQLIFNNLIHKILSFGILLIYLPIMYQSFLIKVSVHVTERGVPWCSG